MRLALISDLHGHLFALEAVLADIQRQAVDQIICLGDTATLGPQPKPVIDRLKALGCPVIQGNHDAALLDLDHLSQYEIAESLRSTLEWCAQRLSADDFTFLRTFQPTLSIPLGGSATLFCYHGSPESNTTLLLATTPSDDVERLLAGQSATVMAGGHSHIQMLRQHNGTLLFNPGSVGCAFVRSFQRGVSPDLLPWAEYGLLRYEDGVLSADLRRVPFDLDAFCALTAHSGLPIADWWLEQYQKG